MLLSAWMEFRYWLCHVKHDSCRSTRSLLRGYEPVGDILSIWVECVIPISDTTFLLVKLKNDKTKSILRFRTHRRFEFLWEQSLLDELTLTVTYHHFHLFKENRWD